MNTLLISISMIAILLLLLIAIGLGIWFLRYFFMMTRTSFDVMEAKIVELQRTFNVTAAENHAALIAKMENESSERVAAFVKNGQAIQTIAELQRAFNVTAAENHAALIAKMEETARKQTADFQENQMAIQQLQDRCKNTFDRLNDLYTTTEQHIRQWEKNFINAQAKNADAIACLDEKLDTGTAALKCIMARLQAGQQKFEEQSEQNRQEQLFLLKTNGKNITDVKQTFTVEISALRAAFFLLQNNLNQMTAELAAQFSTTKTGSRNQRPQRISECPPLTVDLRDSGERIEYTPLEKGKTLSKTYRNGKKIFEMTHSEFGVPLTGIIFDEHGKVSSEFEYHTDGQVKTHKIKPEK